LSKWHWLKANAVGTATDALVTTIQYFTDIYFYIMHSGALIKVVTMVGTSRF